MPIRGDYSADSRWDDYIYHAEMLLHGNKNHAVGYGACGTGAASVLSAAFLVVTMDTKEQVMQAFESNEGRCRNPFAAAKHHPHSSCFFLIDRFLGTGWEIMTEQTLR